jgi:hypothetical protein
VVLGPLSVVLESRAKYAVTWRASQPMEFEQEPASAKERLQILGVVLYTLLVRPRNLILVRDTDFGVKRKAWMNGVIVQRLHVAWDVALAMELVFWLTFATALGTLVGALTP